ncbi:hypothetical protein [Bdellovibrio sp. HCB-110]|uniref:hypothetical protein n=1 Tax=Bdellovibrio sp. HCB-110 TaxID=3391182 RepID=UPI0039B4C195
MMNKSSAHLLTLGMLLMVVAPFWVQSQDDNYIDLLKDGAAFENTPALENEIQTQDAYLNLSDIKMDTEENFKQDTPARSVKVSLGTVENAAFYEVQVIPYKRIWASPMQFTTVSTDPVIRLRLNPGQYQIRTRSLSETKLPGRWGAYQSFWVHFSPIHSAFPKPNAVVEAKSDKTEIITFEWPKAEGTRYYLFLLKNHYNENLRILLTKRNWLREELQIDSQYYWCVFPVQNKTHAFAFLKRTQGVSYNRFSLVKTTEAGRILNIKVSSNSNAEKYQFEVVKVDKSNETSEPSIYDSYSPGLSLKLAPGEYEIRSRYVLGDKVPSEWSSPSNFFIARSPPRPLSPEPQGQVESTDDIQSPTRFEWLADAGAERYEFFLFAGDDTLIEQRITQDPWIIVNLPAGQTYKWYVKALSPREKSTSMTRAPASATEFKINGYTKLELGVSEESSQLYGWVRQISSFSKMKGSNYDINSVVNQTMYSGESELALGYWHRKSKVGALLQAGTAGILLADQYHAFNNAGIHLGYRYILSSQSRIRLWLGYSYRELPEVLTHPFTTAVEVKLLKSMGPELRMAYFLALSEKMGLQLQASYYQGLQDLGTPNGLPLKTLFSYKGSFFGTYKLSELGKLLLGYTYNSEHAEYDTNDPIGLPNSVDLSGHYLSFMYEFGLQDAMK